MTAEAIDRVEWLLGTIEAKKLLGETLTEREEAFSNALARLTNAEAVARNAFTHFYGNLTPAENEAGDENNNLALPTTVATDINEWVLARKEWEDQVQAFLEAPVAPTLVPRTGPRLRAALPEFLRVPTAPGAQDIFHTLMGRPARSALLPPDENAIFTSLSKQGAAMIQTFLSLIGLWLEQNPTQSHETYLTAYASDILRYQGRKETEHGGYHRKDLLAKGHEIFQLSRLTLPSVSPDGQVLTLGRVLSLENLEISAENSENSGHSVLRFRYHLGKTVHDWVRGDNAQFAVISGKLLAYHPVRQKYHILLGLQLARHQSGSAPLSLPDLLAQAGLEVPEKRPAEFLQSIEDALNDLSRDKVIPGLQFIRPAHWPELLEARKTREIIRLSKLVISPQPLVGGK
jgi:hypothetical protein